MGPPNATVSPDGAYFWDGQAWRPITSATPTGGGGEYWDGQGWTQTPNQAREPASRQVSAAPARLPAWSVALVGGAMVVLLVTVAGFGVYLFTGQPAPGTPVAVVTGSPDATASATASPTVLPTVRPSPKPSPTRTPVAVTKPPPALTATIDGSFCPVSRVGETSCWLGRIVNRGPRIGRLAVVFTTRSGYDNWFATHSHFGLQPGDTSPGCSIDAPHLRIVCGPLATGAEIEVHLVGEVAAVGDYQYAVGFADISSGTTRYVDMNPDGTHDLLGWTERIS